METKLLFKAILILLIPFSAIGQTWVSQTSGTTESLLAVQFLDASNGYACGGAGTVLKTINGGTTWTSVNISTATQVNDIYFVSTSEGWAAIGDPNNSSASGEIWHTINGGTTWIQQTPATTEARFGVAFPSATVGWEVGSRNGPINIDATTNAGTAWATQSDAGIFGWLYKIDALSTTTAFSIGGAFFPSVTGFIIKTTNGGSTWSQLSTGTIPFMKGIDMADATTGFVVGDAGFIMSTNNGGTSWTTQTSGTTDTLQDVSFVSTFVGWTCGNTGTIRRSTNSGTSWSAEISGTTQNLNGIYAADTTTAWAVGDGGKIIKRILGTGINEDYSSTYNVNVYPNPFFDYTTIAITNNVNNELLSFVVFDITGKKVREVNRISSSEIIFYREGLSNGIYTFNILDKTNTIVSRGKLLVN